MSGLEFTIGFYPFSLSPLLSSALIFINKFFSYLCEDIEAIYNSWRVTDLSMSNLKTSPSTHTLCLLRVSSEDSFTFLQT